MAYYTPSIQEKSGSYQSKVGECYLFSVKLDFDKAKEYRKSYGAYLRHNQWNDIEVEVYMLIQDFHPTIYRNVGSFFDSIDKFLILTYNNITNTCKTTTQSIVKEESLWQNRY